jgi:hypothetical protein
MFTGVSPYTRRRNLATLAVARRQRVRKRLRLLRRRIRRAIRAELENAVICRMLAQRFPRDSREATVLQLLGRSAVHRVKRLNGLLAELLGPSKLLRKRWLFYLRRLRALYAPRRWALRCIRDRRM